MPLSIHTTRPGRSAVSTKELLLQQQTVLKSVLQTSSPKTSQLWKACRCMRLSFTTVQGSREKMEDRAHARHAERCRLGPPIACLRTLTIPVDPSPRPENTLVGARSSFWGSLGWLARKLKVVAQLPIQKVPRCFGHVAASSLSDPYGEPDAASCMCPITGVGGTLFLLNKTRRILQAEHPSWRRMRSVVALSG